MTASESPQVTYLQVLADEHGNILAAAVQTAGEASIQGEDVPPEVSLIPSEGQVVHELSIPGGRVGDDLFQFDKSMGGSGRRRRRSGIGAPYWCLADLGREDIESRLSFQATFGRSRGVVGAFSDMNVGRVQGVSTWWRRVWVSPRSQSDELATVRDSLVSNAISTDDQLLARLIDEPTITNVCSGHYPSTT